MWNYVTALFRHTLNVNITLDEKNVLFGITGTEVSGLKKQHLKIINHIILIAKMCISKYRYGTPLNLIAMIEYEMKIRNIVIN